MKPLIIRTLGHKIAARIDPAGRTDIAITNGSDEEFTARGFDDAKEAIDFAKRKILRLITGANR